MQVSSSGVKHFPYIFFKVQVQIFLIKLIVEEEKQNLI